MFLFDIFILVSLLVKPNSCHKCSEAQLVLANVSFIQSWRQTNIVFWSLFFKSLSKI